MTDDSRTIDARPTKDFFIRMLIKDISLIQIIPDLVDNCVDGARRIRGNDNFSGLSVRIEVSNDHFRISDNCGGISIELARNYAFRFGRPPDMPVELQVARSTGQFGIGMKRAVFKMGQHFVVESKTEHSLFIVEENVEEWKDKEEWQFEFKELNEELSEPVPPDERGTTLTVTSLHENVAEDFSQDHFLSRLKIELEAKHRKSMEMGLAITLNGIPLQLRLNELLHSDELKPAYREMIIEKPDHSDVRVNIYAGVSESARKNCGWTIFCNGRLILDADKTETTGWGDGNPQYHPQFNRFRGYVFFESDDVALLPWNTTKDGVDADSSTFRAVRLKMIEMMRPVMDFLNWLKEEKEKTDEGPLETAMKTASLFNLSDFDSSDQTDTSSTFVAPKPLPIPPKPEIANILYAKPKDQVEIAKAVLEARSYKEVGEKTFDYFYKMECED